VPAAYANAHVIWWVFASVGVGAFAALMSATVVARFDTVRRPSRPASRQVPQRQAATVRARPVARQTGQV